MEHPRITAATMPDLDVVRALLAASGLPTEGLEPHIDTVRVARQGDGIVGCAALELYGRSAIVRSVAVASHLRGRGLGDELTDAIVELAVSRGVTTLYLLTTTAADYFTRHGFEGIPRTVVPADVKTSIEFTTLCPDSATVMRRHL